VTDIAQTMPWLAPAWQQVQSRLAADRLPHALIIRGERGVGKRDLALAVAGLLLCEARSSNSNGYPLPCGHCRQCRLMAAGSHPDVRAYAPENSRMIRVDQVRALTDFVVASPQVSRHKIAIIDRADQLNVNAANALLKTLEEPQPDVTLLLLQESGRPLLPTIRSRCQSLMVPVPPPDQARRWLQQVLANREGDVPAAERIEQALRLAGYAPGLALDYLDGDFLDLRDKAFAAFRLFMRGEQPVVEAARAFKALGVEEALALFEHWAADLARLSLGGQASDPDAAGMLAYLARHNPPWRVHGLLDAIREARAAVVYNANPELEATRLLLAWQALMPSRPRHR